MLATFALILIANELVRLIWGSDAALPMPAALTGPVELLPAACATRRTAWSIIAVGVAVALLLYFLVTKTKVGHAGARRRIQPRDGARHGGEHPALFTIVFGVGAALCALAGAMLGPILAVQVGMGENILILAFVVIVIGGIGSIRGAFVGALLVGLVDTMGRALLPIAFGLIFQPQVATPPGPALASILIYVLMAAVLFFRPQGLFPARG